MAANSNQSPDQSWKLRPAVQADMSAIRELIHQAHINPMGLEWHHFWIAVDEHDKLIGCGQIKSHSGGIDELASIAVKVEWRGKGVARALIETLIKKHPTSLYLTCGEHLGKLYEKFGFRIINKEYMPQYYRRLARVANLMKAIRLLPEELLIMVRDSDNQS